MIAAYIKTMKITGGNYMSEYFLSNKNIQVNSPAYNHSWWGKYLLVAVTLHIAIISIPVSEYTFKYTGDKGEIEVAVLPEPSPVEHVPPPKTIKPPVSRPFQPPKIQKVKGPPPARAEGKMTAELPQKIVSPDTNPTNEVAQVGPGSGGVAIVGGTGTGGATLSGSGGNPGGSGAGLGRQGIGGGKTGPIDSAFGSGDGPQWLYQEKPVYPYSARRLGKQGRVVLRLTIDEKGNLTKTEVIEATDQIFVQAVIEAARKSKFRAASKNGQDFATRAIWPVNFRTGD